MQTNSAVSMNEDRGAEEREKRYEKTSHADDFRWLRDQT